MLPKNKREHCTHKSKYESTSSNSILHCNLTNVHNLPQFKKNIFFYHFYNGHLCSRWARLGGDPLSPLQKTFQNGSLLLPRISPEDSGVNICLFVAFFLLLFVAFLCPFFVAFFHVLFCSCLLPFLLLGRDAWELL